MSIPTMDDAAKVLADPKAYTDEAGLHGALTHLRAHAPVSWVDVPGYAPFWADHQARRHHGDRARQRRLHQLAAAGAGHQGSRRAAGRHGYQDADPHGRPAAPRFPGDRANWFRPKAMRALKVRADELADTSSTQMAAEGPECDFVQQVAVNYPLYMIMTLLGVPEADFARMLRWTQELFGNDDEEFQRGQSMEERRTGAARDVPVLHRADRVPPGEPHR